ncbi:MAG: hypothetical protein AVDCRST_MAG68-1899, partial [uncultured Gemmatimonadetes bacterium]
APGRRKETATSHRDTETQRSRSERFAGTCTRRLPGASRGVRAGGVGRAHLPRAQAALRDVRQRAHAPRRRARRAVVRGARGRAADAGASRAGQVLRAALRGGEGVDRNLPGCGGRRRAALPGRPILLHPRPQEAPGARRGM